MKTFFLILIIVVFSSAQDLKSQYASISSVPRVLKVPGEFSTIAGAVDEAKEGDLVIISPGTYREQEIEITKAITVSSEWKLDGEISKINETIIDAGDKILFSIKANGVEISGLKIVNGNHTLDITAKATIIYNHFTGNLDAMSFEPGSGGYVAYNTAENDRDDALDMDIGGSKRNFGYDIVVEHNIIRNCNDDGIEIRLYTSPDQNINYKIRKNKISGSKNAGIQLISYDKYTGKVFEIHHNVIQNCKVGLGCMGGSKTVEDLGGAPLMDEQVYFYNNTISGNDMGATGGNNILAVNNIISDNKLGGFKLFGKNSTISNNLFFNNGDQDLISINDSALESRNIFSTDPLLNKASLLQLEESPCTDAGIKEFRQNDRSLKISQEYYNGSSPDLGAYEEGGKEIASMHNNASLVDAGEDIVLKSPIMNLKGSFKNKDGKSYSILWKSENDPGNVEISDPTKPETKAILHHQGIYTFSFTGSSGNSIATDYVTARFAGAGEGKRLFFSGKENIIIEAEDYAYIYGGVKPVENNKMLQLVGSKEDPAGLEYSVGVPESNEYFLWLLIRTEKQGNKIIIEFNNKVIGESSPVKSSSFEWVKLPGKIIATPGQWSLFIKNIGNASLDKIIMSDKPDFNPMNGLQVRF